MTRPRLLLRVAALALAVVGCSPHDTGNFDDGPQIGQDGISVPVPPPSLKAAPVQRVDVEGELPDSSPEPKTRVELYEAVSGRGYFTFAAGDGSFRIEDVLVDLTDNCLEVWWQQPGPNGEISMSSFFRAEIGEDDQSVVTEQFFSGC